MPLPGQSQFNEIHKCSSLKIRRKNSDSKKSSGTQLPKVWTVPAILENTHSNERGIFFFANRGRKEGRTEGRRAVYSQGDFKGVPHTVLYGVSSASVIISAAIRPLCVCVCCIRVIVCVSKDSKNFECFS